MAWTPVESAILSRLAYYGSDKGQGQIEKGESLYEVLQDPEVKNYLINSLGDQYCSNIEKLAEKVKGKDYFIANTSNDSKTGFFAYAIEDPEHRATVVARGTEGFDVSTPESRKDVDNDIQLAYLLSTDQQKNMEALMNQLEKENYDGYYFTGHSLGGNLATYAAIVSVPTDKVTGVSTFDSPGFNEGFCVKHSKKIPTIADRIVNYQNECDLVSSLLNVPGKAVIVEAVGKGFIENHYEKNLKLSGDDFVPNKSQKKRVMIKLSAGIIEGLRIVAGSKQLSLFLGLLELGVLFGEKGKYHKIEAYYTNAAEAKSSHEPQKRKFSTLSMAITGGMAIVAVVSYLLTAPSNLFMFLGWLVAVLLPYASVFLLLRLRTPLAKWLRSKTGGIILAALFCALTILIPWLYIVFSVLFLILLGLFLLSKLTDMVPNMYFVTIEEADGSVRTEVHTLGDNCEQDIAFIDANYKSKGYTKK